VSEFPDFTDCPDFPEAAVPGVDGGPGYRLSVVPVTVRQYRAFVRARGRLGVPTPQWHAAAALAEGLDDELPVTSVTWHGAAAYAAWLGASTGRPIRLPDEAEWRRAAGGPDGWHWSLGDHFDRPVYAPAARAARPVGCTGPNPYGLRDLTGNVFEWCAGGPPDVPAGSRVIKGGAYTVRNPESFANATVFTADALTTVPYLGFRVLAEAGPLPG
jgi:formylglycine-generating enzyme required for sulfatase activity